MYARLSAQLAAVGLFASLLGACATLPPPVPRLGLTLAPATLGASISVQQHLKVERDGRIDELDTALEIDPQRLEMVGLAFGQRVLTLHYDGQKLQSSRHPLLPAQVRAEDVLEDLQLTLWPADVIRQALPAGWRIEESGLRRMLFSGDVPVMTIDYSGPVRWSGKVELSNLRYHYRLTIQSAS